MQVITLDPGAFVKHAERLALMIAKCSGVSRFDAVVGVRRGGAVVCDALCRYLPENYYVVRSDVSLQRPSTKRKGGKVNKVLKMLPLPILDFLRMAESMLLSLHKKLSSSRSKTASQVLLSDELKDVINGKKCPTILIIDDAIDSGDTLQAIMRAVKIENPNAEIVTAVITTTTSNPVVRPDFSLYRNHTLIRFPWSNDYRK